MAARGSSGTTHRFGDHLRFEGGAAPDVDSHTGTHEHCNSNDPTATARHTDVDSHTHSRGAYSQSHAHTKQHTSHNTDVDEARPSATY